MSAPARAAEAHDRRQAHHRLRPRLPVPLRRLDHASGGARAAARRAAWPGGRHRRRRHGRHDGGLRADEARPQARHLRERAHRRAARSEAFQGAEGIIAELGGMRFPVSSTAFYHYLGMSGLEVEALPQSAVARDALDRHRSGRLDHLRARRWPTCRRSTKRWRRPGRRRWRRALISRPCRRRSARATSRSSRRSGTSSCRSGTTAPSTAISRPRKRSPSAASGISKCSARSASAPAAGIATIRTRCWKSCASSSPPATTTSATSSAASSSCRAGCGGTRPKKWCTGRRAPRSKCCIKARRGRACAASAASSMARSPSPTAGAW